MVISLLQEEKEIIANTSDEQLDNMKQELKKYQYENQVISLEKYCNEKVEAVTEYSNSKVTQQK